MRKISIFKRIKFFKEYKKILKDNSKELELSHNVRIDRAYRMYTVVNVPRELFGEAFSIRKKDINDLSLRYIKDETTELSTYLNNIGLNELFDMYEIRKVDKYSYLLIIGFSQFKSNKYYNWLVVLYSVLGISVLTLFLMFL